jgi:hypothetical protein
MSVTQCVLLRFFLWKTKLVQVAGKTISGTVLFSLSGMNNLIKKTLQKLVVPVPKIIGSLIEGIGLLLSHRRLPTVILDTLMVTVLSHASGYEIKMMVQFLCNVLVTFIFKL